MTATLLAPAPVAPKLATRDYVASVQRTYMDPEIGLCVETEYLEVTVAQGFLPGVGGEIAKVRLYLAQEYPGYDLVDIHFAEDMDVEF
jgi:hypothetical protein